jgi:PAS domain S-box-containing protein
VAQLSQLDLRSLLDHVPTLHTLVRRTADGLLILDVNEAVLRSTGFTRDEVVGRDLSEIQPPEVTATVTELVDRALATSSVVTDKLDLRTPAGAQRFGLTYVPAPELGPDIVVSMSVDLTGELRSERELERTQQLAGLGTWSWDMAADRLEWSDEVLRLFGVDADSFEGTDEAFVELLHPDDAPAVLATIERAIAEGRPYDVRHRIVRPDGTVRHVSGIGDVVRDPDGTTTHVVGISQDVTLRVEEAEHAIEAQRHAQALDLNDDVLQGLARARLHLALGDSEGAIAALDATAAAARDIVHALLGGDAGTPVRPGDLVRARAAGGGS